VKLVVIVLFVREDRCLLSTAKLIAPSNPQGAFIRQMQVPVMAGPALVRGLALVFFA